jgi:hypothetical protein
MIDYESIVLQAKRRLTHPPSAMLRDGQRKPLGGNHKVHEAKGIPNEQI